ncbi:MAG: hypothetical protein WBJ54_09505, partial [Syntrophorhabdus sp.]
MKFYSSIVSYLVEGKSTKQNMRMLIRFLVMLTAMITVYSIIFHFLMAWEEREYSWVTGFYWTLTV